MQAMVWNKPLTLYSRYDMFETFPACVLVRSTSPSLAWLSYTGDTNKEEAFANRDRIRAGWSGKGCPEQLAVSSLDLLLTIRQTSGNIIKLVWFVKKGVPPPMFKGFLFRTVKHIFPGRFSSGTELEKRPVVTNLFLRRFPHTDSEGPATMNQGLANPGQATPFPRIRSPF